MGKLPVPEPFDAASFAGGMAARRSLRRSPRNDRVPMAVRASGRNSTVWPVLRRAVGVPGESTQNGLWTGRTILAMPVRSGVPGRCRSAVQASFQLRAGEAFRCVIGDSPVAFRMGKGPVGHAPFVGLYAVAAHEILSPNRGRGWVGDVLGPVPVGTDTEEPMARSTVSSWYRKSRCQGREAGPRCAPLW